ncbi:DNA topoisomerase [Lysinibacillus sp. UGB7]|uniref:type IA DNA topoisomerase n=1 Tax=Lysinibacillus sp. UGB7 TaxID=3411039 RepID=UPI003B815561
MTTLIIAEKRDAARSIAEALSPQHTDKEGFIQGSNNLIYTWASGHLLEIKSPGEMKKEWEDWAWETLPMIPESIQLKPIAKSLKQLGVIKKLVNDASVIINAADAGTEGEVIFNFIAIYLRFNKPIYRLWTSSLQPVAIQKAYKAMKPASDYNALKQAGFSRAISDWIIGLNATRALTLAGGGKTIHAGRVQTPVLALVYDRYKERSSFTKLKYFPLLATFSQGDEKYQGYFVGDRMTVLNHAKSICEKINMQSGKITSIKEEKKQTPPPLLMDLTDISRIANQKFSYTAFKTLEIIQELYLKKYVTYPRTGSRYITVDEIPLMHKSFDVLKDQFSALAHNGDKSLVNEKNSRIVNPKKVVDHHALLPEPVIATNLSKDEENVYMIVVERFFSQFQQPLHYNQLEVETEVQGIYFKSKFKQTINLGWTAILKEEEYDENTVKTDGQELNGYPTLAEAEVVCKDVKIEEKETSPPAAYTDGSLIDTMSNISNKISDPFLKAKLKDCGIGTSATRANIIKKLIETEYLAYEKKSISITKKGINVIEMLRKTNIRLLTSPELTAQWEKELEEIRNGKSSKSFMDGIKNFANIIIEEAKSLKVNSEDFIQTYGKCPTCGKNILLNRTSYYCSGYKEGCKFFIWATQFHKNITPKMLEQLLLKGKTSKLTFSSQKSTKSAYKAKLILPKNLDGGKLELEFDAKQ